MQEKNGAYTGWAVSAPDNKHGYTSSIEQILLCIPFLLVHLLVETYVRESAIPDRLNQRRRLFALLRTSKAILSILMHLLTGAATIAVRSAALAELAVRGIEMHVAGCTLSPKQRKGNVGSF